MLCVFLYLISTQSLTLAHDLTHTGHEQINEVCEALNIFGASKDCISTQSSDILLSTEQITPSLRLVSAVNTSLAIHRHSRAPPYSSIQGLSDNK